MSKEIRVPLEIVSFQDDGYHVFVRGWLEKCALRLLIDTGASKTVLDKNFLTANFPDLKLESNEMPATGAGSNTIQTEIAEVSGFFLSTDKKKTPSLEKFQVAVLDLSHVNDTYSKIGQPSIQGVIGSDLLVQFGAIINIKKQRMKLKVPPGADSD